MLGTMDVDELQHALGGIVLESAYLERMLRSSFTALTGSKYAAAIDGRMTAHALIEDCQRIARVRTDLPEAVRSALAEALDACDAANRKRNRVIHDAWAYRPDDLMVTLQADRDSRDVAVVASTVEQVTVVARQIGAAAAALAAALTSALGPDSLRIEDELRLELGHAVNADVG
jgi:hypothetical protein